MDRLSTTRSALLITLAAGFWLAACTSPQNNGGADTSRSTPETRQLGLPSDVVRVNIDRLLHVGSQLVELEIARCMVTAGFDYSASLTPWSPSNFSEGRYGLDSQAQAERYGYQSPPSGNEVSAPDIVQPQVGLPEYQLALYGKASDTLSMSVKTYDGVMTIPAPAGCAGEGFAAIYGSREEYLETFKSVTRAEEMSNLSLIALASSKEAAALTELWYACMESKGEGRFINALEPFGFAWETTEDERSVALNDVLCKEQVDYVERSSEFERQWQTDNLPNYLGDLERLERQGENVLRRFKDTAG